MTTYTGSGVDDQGNTINFTMTATIAPATIYVAANGSDANNGRSPATAYKTIDKVNSIVLPRGGKVLFNGGDLFVGNFKPNIDGNGDVNNPLVVGSYGAWRGIIMPAFGGETGIVDVDRMSGVVVQDLNLTAPDIAKMPRGGVLIRNNSAERRSNITVQRCDISGIRYGEATGYQGGQVFVEGYPGTGGIENILIQNNVLHGRDGVASRDDTGIAGFGNGRNIFNMIQRGNLCYHIGGSSMLPAISPTQQGYPPMGDGLDFNGVQGGLCEFNIVHDNAWNYTNQGGGPCAILTGSSADITVQFCEGYNIQPASAWPEKADFVGLDLDYETENSLGQFNYMHDNYNSGVMLFSNGSGGWNNNTLRKNLCVNNCKSGMLGFGEITVTVPGGFPTLHVDDNMTYNDRVYNGVMYQTLNQGSAGITFNREGSFNGTVNNNVSVVSPTIYSSAAPFIARGTPVNNPVGIVGNEWFLRNGGGIDMWWGPASYNSLAGWEAASGKGPNTLTYGPGPEVFTTTYALALTAAERAIAADALAAIISLPGIDIVGPRADALRTRLLAGDSPVTLPEFIALGFALTRADTPAATALLARVKSIVLAS